MKETIENLILLLIGSYLSWAAFDLMGYAFEFHLDSAWIVLIIPVLTVILLVGLIGIVTGGVGILHQFIKHLQR